jgi:hypothetical protein
VYAPGRFPFISLRVCTLRTPDTPRYKTIQEHNTHDLKPPLSPIPSPQRVLIHLSPCKESVKMRIYPMIAATIAIVISVGCSPNTNESTAQRPSDASPAAVLDVREHLVTGEQLPQFKCEGWLNGMPPTFDSNMSGLIVVDLWGKW